MRRRLILTTGLVLLLSGTARSDAIEHEKLVLRVTPQVSNAPGTVVVQATVMKAAGNRSLSLEVDSGTFFRRSDIQLDGDRAPLITEVRLNDLPQGEYTVTAVLRDTLDMETVVRRTASVLP